MDPSSWCHIIQNCNTVNKKNIYKGDNNLTFFSESFSGSNTLFTQTTGNSTPTAMGIQITQQSFTHCVDEPDSFAQNDSFAVESSTSENVILRRNLTEAFEELYVDVGTGISEAETPTSTKLMEDDFTSPNGVMDIDNFEPLMDDSSIPTFRLHPDLKRDLSQPLVNRVSIYAIIHDINKEASDMASNDQSTFLRAKSMDDDEDGLSPIVIAVSGAPSILPSSHAIVDACLIDEERWLLSAIGGRGDDECRSISSCPPTFSQAMGERDYDDTTSTLGASRTQLWKPSRSWWEAKSGKNPWIEPKSHNKRWR